MYVIHYVINILALSCIMIYLFILQIIRKGILFQIQHYCAVVSELISLSHFKRCIFEKCFILKIIYQVKKKRRKITVLQTTLRLFSL